MENILSETSSGCKKHGNIQTQILFVLLVFIFSIKLQLGLHKNTKKFTQPGIHRARGISTDSTSDQITSAGESLDFDKKSGVILTKTYNMDRHGHDLIHNELG